MFVIKMIRPSVGETGWAFETKEKAEEFLMQHKFLQLGTLNGINDTWASAPTRGATVYTSVVYIEENNETDES